MEEDNRRAVSSYTRFIEHSHTPLSHEQTSLMYILNLKANMVLSPLGFLSKNLIIGDFSP